MQVVISAVGPDHRGLADPIVHYVTGHGANIAEIQMYDHDEDRLFAMLLRMDFAQEEFDDVLIEIGAGNFVGRALGHDLQRRVGRAADHGDAHELKSEGSHLGLDHPLQAGNVRHRSCPSATNVSRTGAAGPQPQASHDVEERAAI